MYVPNPNTFDDLVKVVCVKMNIPAVKVVDAMFSEYCVNCIYETFVRWVKGYSCLFRPLKERCH